MKFPCSFDLANIQCLPQLTKVLILYSLAYSRFTTSFPTTRSNVLHLGFTHPFASAHQAAWTHCRDSIFARCPWPSIKSHPVQHRRSYVDMVASSLHHALFPRVSVWAHWAAQHIGSASIKARSWLVFKESAATNAVSVTFERKSSPLRSRLREAVAMLQPTGNRQLTISVGQLLEWWREKRLKEQTEVSSFRRRSWPSIPLLLATSRTPRDSPTDCTRLLLAAAAAAVPIKGGHYCVCCYKNRRS